MIRPAQKNDLDNILLLNETFVPKVSRVDIKWLEKYCHEADVFDVFVDGNEVLGFIVGMLPDCDYGSENFLWFKKRYTDFLYIDRIAIAEKSHGRGIGKSLYENVERNFIERVRNLMCEVNVSPPNPQSYHFHQKIGFHEVGQQDTKGGTIRVAMLMKELR